MSSTCKSSVSITVTHAALLSSATFLASNSALINEMSGILYCHTHYANVLYRKIAYKAYRYSFH